MIPDEFVPGNVIDNCSLINLVSSLLFLRTSIDTCRHYYIVTPTVLYECLVKSRGKPLSEARIEVRRRVEMCLNKSEIKRMEISIDDLQCVSRQDIPKKVGKGELL